MPTQLFSLGNFSPVDENSWPYSQTCSCLDLNCQWKASYQQSITIIERKGSNLWSTHLYKQWIASRLAVTWAGSSSIGWPAIGNRGANLDTHRKQRLPTVIFEIKGSKNMWKRITFVQQLFCTMQGWNIWRLFSGEGLDRKG